MKPRRVLIGLTEIAGYNAKLKRGFEELGVQCMFLNQHAHPFNYGGDDSHDSLLKIQRWANAWLDNSESLPVKVLFYCIIQILNIPLFFRILFKNDIFIFGYGSTFLGYYDLPILRFFKKRIVYVFFGSDERPSYLDGALIGPEKGRTIKDCIRLTANQKRKIQRIEKYADFCISHPASAHLHTRPFVQWLAIGIPAIIQPSNEHSWTEQVSDHIRILHAPSDPEAKGSEIIRLTINALKEKGYPIEYVEITGMPNAVVLQELQRCDFVIDQVFSDTPMAMLATEAAAFGKPTLVGGYYAEQLCTTIPNDLIPPSLYCHPDKIPEAIEMLVVDNELRADLGRRALKYVQENWTPLKVAEHYMQLIEDGVPDAWYYNPEEIRYLHGVALSEVKVQSLIRSVIETGGVGALQIMDKPLLEERFLKFAYKR